MNSIIPNLWFDRNAEDAVKFYTNLFPNSNIGKMTFFGKEGFEYHKMPEGTIMTIDFELHGQKFVALNGGPVFQFNESLSFYVYCASDEAIENLYRQLSEGGQINMPLNKYDWSEKYAWVKDKYGVSWQLDIDKINSQQKIVPSMLFVNDKYTMVKEAVQHYTSIFPDSRLLFEASYPTNANTPDGTILFSQFSLSGNLFNAMSGAGEHKFDFNESVSFIVNCESQEEVDYYWDKLTEGGAESMCGWLKDKYGISWQVVPTEIFKYIEGGDAEKRSNAINAMFQMKKLDIQKLKQSYEGK